MGTPGPDELLGTEGDDLIQGLAGDDVLRGLGGNDRIEGGDGNDLLFGGQSDDRLFGGLGDDNLSDDQGSNELSGGDGNDSLYGTSINSAQVLSGGAGHDQLTAGGSQLTLLGGDGNDSLNAGGGTPTGTSQRGQAALSGSSGDDYLHASYLSSALLQGEDGDDILFGVSSKALELQGGAGNDQLTAQLGSYFADAIDDALGANFSLNGGEDDDVLTASIHAGKGHTVSDYGLIDALLEGGAGNDVLRLDSAGMKQATLIGGSGQDSLSAAGVLELTLTGGAGTDTFELTSQQYQTVVGAVQTFRTERSTLAGGAAQFATVTPLPVEVSDFQASIGGDVLALDQLLGAAAVGLEGRDPFATGYLTLLQTGLDATLLFDADGAAGASSEPITLAVLRGVNLRDLTAANFCPAYAPPRAESPPTGAPTGVLAAGTEDIPYELNAAVLLQGFSDADGDALSVTLLSANHGALVDAGNGTWNLTPETDYNGLVSLSYEVTDGRGGALAASLDFSLAPVDDPAVLGSADVTVPETNAPITATGALAIADVDSPAAFVAQPATAGHYGVFTIAANGSWTYKANLAFDYLNLGDSLKDTFHVTSTDGGTSTCLLYTSDAADE